MRYDAENSNSSLLHSHKSVSILFNDFLEMALASALLLLLLLLFRMKCFKCAEVVDNIFCTLLLLYCSQALSLYSINTSLSLSLCRLLCEASRYLGEILMNTTFLKYALVLCLARCEPFVHLNKSTHTHTHKKVVE